MANRKPRKLLISLLILPTSLLILLSLTNLSHISPTSLSPIPPCNLFTGEWTFKSSQTPTYNSTCPFHRNSWNCFKNKNPKMGMINNYKWVPRDCDLDRIDPGKFLGLMRNKRVGFVGDSLSENLVVAFLCALRNGDYEAKKWKDKKIGVWRGGYFPKYNFTMAYHRAVLLAEYRAKTGRISNFKWVPRDCDLDRIDPVDFLNLTRNMRVGFVGDSLSENLVVAFLCVLRNGDYEAKKWKDKKIGVWRGGYFPKFNFTMAYHCAGLLANYRWQPKQTTEDNDDGVKGIYRVDVDVPADDWAHIINLYDVLIFNTGHWWGYDKFPKETPLVFYKGGEPINPPLEMMDGLKVVLKSMVSYIEREVPANTLKFWRLQSPRHFYGGEWNQNGSCLFDKPLDISQLDMWFDPSNDGVNKEARLLNGLIKEALQETNIQLLDLTHLSEFRADAHPAIWLGKKDAVSVWGQDCLHWCLPGVPDTWVDIISQLILHRRL